MDILRTPDERFADLPDFPYDPRYVKVGEGLRMHYVAAGPKDGPLVLLLHGEPSWSFLYRHMIRVLAENGCRVLAPDLIGFGRSDKPTDTTDYTYDRHLTWLRGWIKALDLRDINLFCQDWGGLLGLPLAVEMPDRFARIVASNTILPTGDIEPNEAFTNWLKFSQSVPEFPIGKILQSSTTTELPPPVIAAYEAPFPDERYKAGARAFPALVPIRPDMPGGAANRVVWEKLSEWTKPFLTLFGDSDPIMRGMEKIFIRNIPGAKMQAHRIVDNAGHFIQEDQGEEVAREILTFIQTTTV